MRSPELRSATRDRRSGHERDAADVPRRDLRVVPGDANGAVVCTSVREDNSEAYPRAVPTRRRWPIAVFVVAMVVGALAIGLSVYVLWAVSHFD